MKLENGVLVKVGQNKEGSVNRAAVGLIFEVVDHKDKRNMSEGRVQYNPGNWAIKRIFHQYNPEFDEIVTAEHPDLKKFTDFHAAWHFLEEHHIFEDKKHKSVDFQGSLYTAVVRVNPVTNEVDDDETLNTKTQVWLECGEWVKEEDFEGFCHNTDLDCGGDTFEAAIIELANIVLEKFGENPEGYGQPTEEEMAEAEAFFAELKSRGDVAE